MTPHLDHTIVWSADRAASARFLAEILDVGVGAPNGPFVPIELGAGLTLDYADADPAEIHPQHYAFRVDDALFDAALERIVGRGIPYAADPFYTRLGAVYAGAGGDRGVYFRDPSGHSMELLTTGQNG
jgi:catechol 2,3-dioxygenase-like lactoylglutathione lyase family enzyme